MLTPNWTLRKPQTSIVSCVRQYSLSSLFARKITQRCWGRTSCVFFFFLQTYQYCVHPNRARFHTELKHEQFQKWVYLNPSQDTLMRTTLYRQCRFFSFHFEHFQLVVCTVIVFHGGKRLEIILQHTETPGYWINKPDLSNFRIFVISFSTNTKHPGISHVQLGLCCRETYGNLQIFHQQEKNRFDYKKH